MTEFPKNPKGHDVKCETCSHWLASEKKLVAFTGQGPVELSVIRASGAIFTGPKGEVAPCTVMPEWAVKSSNWWCGQWLGVPD